MSGAGSWRRWGNACAEWIAQSGRGWAKAAAAQAIVLFAQAITAVRAIWQGVAPVDRQRVYFANHVSNGDFVMLWAALPSKLRKKTRPVAAADYWLVNPWRRFAGREVFNAVLIDRNPETRREDPVGQMVTALDEGSSLIIFPEGQRNMTEARLLPFRTGLYHLARQRPDIDLVPAWIENLNRVMPKGEVVPIPIICTVTFGEAIHLAEGEGKEAFLNRAATALSALMPRGERIGRGRMGGDDAGGDQQGSAQLEAARGQGSGGESICDQNAVGGMTSNRSAVGEGDDAARTGGESRGENGTDGLSTVGVAPGGVSSGRHSPGGEGAKP